jgi:hypothetical protein
MGAAWRDHSTMIILAVVILPIGGLATYLWLRRSRSRRDAFAEVGLVFWTLPFLGMLFTPQPAPRSVDLVPLHDLPSWVSGDPSTALAQVGGNLLVLAGVGFFLPVLFAEVASLPRVLGIAVGASVLIESLQWVLAIGRVSSVDDVLVNTIGAVLAAALSRRWWASGNAGAKRQILPVA